MKLWKKTNWTGLWTLLHEDLSASALPSGQDLDELETFISLQKAGMSASAAASLSFRNSALILDGLEQGMSLDRILEQEKGWSWIGALTGCLDFSQAVAVLRSLAGLDAFVFQETASKLAYPACLLAGSLAILLFFEWCILPVMDSYLQTGGTALLFGLCKWVLLLFCLGCVLLGGAHAVGVRGQSPVLCRLKLVQQVQSLQFLSLFQTFQSAGLATGMILELMLENRQTPYQRALCLAVQSRLLQGRDLLDALAVPLLDDSCLPFVECGLAGGNLDHLLTAWKQKTEAGIRSVLKRTASVLSYISYVQVGVLAILVYQVLLAPMNLLYAI